MERLWSTDMLTKTLNGIVCEVCNKRFSGDVPAQQHLQSAAHIRKVQQSQLIGHGLQPRELYCSVCCLQCNSTQQLLTHQDSPRHQQMVKQNDVIRQEQALTAACNGGGGREETASVFTAEHVRVRQEIVGDREDREVEELPGSKQFNTESVSGNMAGIWAGAAGSQAPRITTEVGGVFFEGGRGYCHVCKIELTSPQHKAQHVEGKNHKKRLAQTSGGMGAGVMMCAICEVPLSGELNVQQHFSSERHRKRVVEQQTLKASCGVNPPNPTVPSTQFSGGNSRVPWTSAAPAHTTAMHGGASAGQGLMPQNVTAGQFQSPTTAFGELSFSPLTSSYPSSHLTQTRPAQAVTAQTSQAGSAMNTQSGSEILRFEWSHSGCGWCGFCDIQVNSLDEVVEHLKSEEHRQKEDESRRESCEICRVKFLGPASAKQHFSSESHKKQAGLCVSKVTVTPYGQEGTGTAFLLGGPTFSDEMTSSQLSRLMSDYANFEETFKKKLVVDSPSTSVAVDQQPYSSQTFVKHSYSETLPSHVSGDGNTGLNQLSGNITASAVAQMHYNMMNIPPSEHGGETGQAVPAEGAPQRPSVPEYVFDGERGVCNVCGVTFTSRPHAESHLAGSKHQKAKQRWNPSQSLAGPGSVMNTISTGGSMPSATPPFRSQSPFSPPVVQFNPIATQFAPSAAPYNTTASFAPPSTPFQPEGPGLGFQVPTSEAHRGSPVTVTPEQPGAGSKGYRFDGDRGYCFACKIDLTSVQHANQHLVGRRHQVAVERWQHAGQGCVYPLYCETCHKPFTGQESAAQHFASEKHKKKAMLAAGASTGRKDPETGALIVTQDGQIWYICEVCNCPLNTLDQMRIHLRSPRHNKEVEKAQKSQQAMSQNFEANINDLSAADERPGSANSAERVTPYSGLLTTIESSTPGVNYEHLVQAPMVATTPEILQPAQEVPGCGGQVLRAGLLQVTSGAGYARAILGTSSDTSGGGQTSSGIITFSKCGGSDTAGENSQSAGSTSQTMTSGRAGSESRTDGQNLTHTMNQAATAFSSGSLGRGTGGNGTSSAPGNGSSDRADGTGLGRYGQSPYGSGDLDGLNMVKQTARGNRSGGYNKRSGQVIRPDGDYEYDDDEEDRNIGPLGLTTSYTDPPPDDSADQTGNGLESMSTIATPSQHLSSTVSEHERRLARENDGLPPNNLLPNVIESPPSLGSLSDINQRQPERGVIRGFRYGCQLCQQPMNTKEDYDKHMNGLKHQMKAATVGAPDKSSEPLIKTKHTSLEEAYQVLGKSSPRTYQVELMCKAMASDSVVFLPTGTGKTLAAMMTLSYMLTLNPTRPALFLVDKVLLVLQQARYIINELGSREYLRPHLNDDSQGRPRMVKRNLKVAVLCGGLSVRDGTPLWKHDVVVTTAAFCQNLLQMGVLRWANLSLVVFDEAHHCTKNHPYNKLLTEHHLKLPLEQRPKVLGLTASPAGRRTKEETLAMLQKLLENLGGATIATVEGDNEKAQLDKYSSSALLVPVCVPMTEAEVRFHQQLLAYFIQAYLELMRCSNLPQMSDRALKDLCSSSKPDPKKIQALAQQLMEMPDQLSELVQLAHTARIKNSSYQMIQFHVMTVGMALLNSEDGIDFVLDELEREFDANLNPNFNQLCNLGLPCKDIAAFVKSIMDAARLRADEGSSEEEGGVAASASKMSIFQELLRTLASPDYISWSSDDAMALVLVRERKVAHKVREQLKKASFVRDQHLDVAVVVGHGAGSGEGEGMNLRKQDKVLQGIKSRRYKIVVATSVAEEGVDLPECQLVVCLNPPTTVKAMVQMRGRARKKNSYFVVLCSSQKEKEKLEDLKRQEDNMKWAAEHLTRQNAGVASSSAD